MATADIIQSGTNVTVTGNGSEATPYVISSTGGGGAEIPIQNDAPVAPDINDLWVDADAECAGSPVANNPPRAEIMRSTMQSITSATWTLMVFDTEVKDIDNLYDDGGLEDRFTIRTAGRYQVSCSFEWTVIGGSAVLAIAKGATLPGGHQAKQTVAATTGVNRAHTVTTEFDLIVGDVITFQVWHNSGSGVNIQANSTTAPCRATIRRVCD